ncbi:MAG: ECF-type sigma factor [Gemmatimonadaceae bacterium]
MVDHAERWAESLAPRLYEELKVLASSHLRRERPGHTLGTTALVHEAWLRIAAHESLAPDDSTRFFAIAATTMRRVLVDHARRRSSDKRGGGEVPARIEDVDDFLSIEESEELLALDDALERLAKANPRAANVVIARFFGGLSEAETAKSLNLSPKTVQRDWLVARAWLRKEVALDLGRLIVPDDDA